MLHTISRGIKYDTNSLGLRTGGVARLTEAPSGHLLLDPIQPPKDLWQTTGNPELRDEEISVYGAFCEELTLVEKLTDCLCSEEGDAQDHTPEDNTQESQFSIPSRRTNLVSLQAVEIGLMIQTTKNRISSERPRGRITVRIRTAIFPSSQASRPNLATISSIA